MGLITAAFFINLMRNRYIERISYIMAFFKIAGIALLAIGGLIAAGFSPGRIMGTGQSTSIDGFLGATALALLAFKGFTTITNSGAEIRDPHRNVGKAIIISIAVCLSVYILVTSAVSMNLTVPEIVRARDYSLAQAARPAFGELGVWITVSFAVIATISGIIVSIFAVSRMLAMLTEMKLVPHRHFGMPGDIQKHTMVYTAVIAIVFTLLLDLGRIAAIGAVFYIVMDIAIHWGVFRRLRHDIGANGLIMIAAIVLDLVILAALLYVKALADPTVLLLAVTGILLVLIGERIFLSQRD
jgi:amino acid transporter